MKLSRILTAGLMTLAAAGAQAVPAYPGLIEARQPDGTPLTIRLQGDENFSWAQSADGYTLLRDAQGYWTVAQNDASGILVPSKLRVSGKSAAAQAAKLGVPAMLPMTKATADTYRKAPAKAPLNLQVDATFPTKGKRKLLMLLVNYADTKPTYTKQDFENFMNQKNYMGIGSFRDFYLENSYGQFDVETTVTEWITLPGNKRTYTDQYVTSMIDWALGEASRTIDLTQFDNDGDGVLDGLAVIHQGTGQEVTGDTGDIWSHSSVIYGMNIGGVDVRRYTIQPELLGITPEVAGAPYPMTTIGVMCHEFGHNLGAPDFYDTDYSNSGGEYGGTGKWDLLGSGAWNGVYGNRPPHINVWQKMMFGWIEPEVLSETTKVTAMPDITTTPKAYIFHTTSDNDYFMLENRQLTGDFNSAMPGHGMLITHVNEKLISQNVMANTLNAAFPQACYTVAANASSDPNERTTSYGYPNTETATYPQEKSTSFTDFTIPSTRAVDGRWAYKGLTNIVENADGTIGFDFTVGDIPGQPQKVAAITEGSDVILTWEAPEGEKPVGYNVYRGTKALGFVTETRFTDTDSDKKGRLEYLIDAKYADERLSPTSTVVIRVPEAKVNTLEAASYEDGVRLTWTLNPNISRMQDYTHSTEDFRLRDISGMKVEYGHRYTVEDLKTYVGMKIRRIAFLPYQSLQESTFVVNVYEADADGSNPTVVSSRQIKEMGAGIWNTALLTKAVEIKPGHEYWTTIELVPKIKVGQLITEPTDVLDGFNNLLRINDGAWSSDKGAEGAFYLYAILNDAASEQVAEVTGAADEMDPDRDLYFPIGFRIYRDGQLIGQSASRTFVDSPNPGGKHTYSVSTLYKGDNETSPCEAIEVNTDEVLGIDAITAEPAAEQPLYRPDGTRVPATRATKGLYLRKGEKILK